MHVSLHCEISPAEIVKPTYLCCDKVKQISLNSLMIDDELDAPEVTMPALATRPTRTSHAAPRGSDLPTCTVCADTMIAAEASAFVTDDEVSYLWTCDTCGYGFVTKHALKKINRN
jgi:hypothetical protein